MTDVLDRIAAYKREDVAARKAALSQDAVEARAALASAPRGFRAALDSHVVETGRPALIAEIKKASPSKGLIRADFDPPALAKAYERGGATCLSVLTDGPSFQGDDAYLAAARNAVALPCLRKDFLVDPWQVAESRALGADCILIILAMIDDALAAELLSEAERFRMDALIETHDEAEMARACKLGGDLVGVNNRSCAPSRSIWRPPNASPCSAPSAPCWWPRAASSPRTTCNRSPTPTPRPSSSAKA